ncbi:MAG: hypothetical protein HY286_13625 [Planctomycetes bacterium]|nr:hypothetical protein [Planctomycetota bacterium]
MRIQIVGCIVLAAGLTLNGASLSQDGQNNENKSRVAIENNEVVVEGTVRLGQFVNVVAPFVKQTLIMKRDVLAKLESTNVVFSQPMHIPAAKANEFFEYVLFEHDFVIQSGTSAALPSLIVDLKGPDRLSIRAHATYINEAQIEQKSGRMGYHFTVVTLHNTSAREVSASLRPFFPDNQIETVTNIGNANSLLVFAFSQNLNALAKLIHEIDKAAAEPPPALPKNAGVGEAAKFLKTAGDRIESLEKQVADLKQQLQKAQSK